MQSNYVQDNKLLSKAYHLAEISKLHAFVILKTVVSEVETAAAVKASPQHNRCLPFCQGSSAKTLYSPRKITATSRVCLELQA